jgi:hypothetical protein
MKTSFARYPRLCQAGVHRELTHSPKSILAWITVMVKDMVVYHIISHSKLGNGALILPRQSFNQQLESSYAEGRAKQRRSRNHGRGFSLLPQLL